MPQAACPDINVSIIRYREILHEGYRIKDYTMCNRAIQALNGLLPPNLRIVFVNRMYYEKGKKTQLILECPACESKSPVDLMHYEPSSFKESVLGMEPFDFVECPKCKTPCPADKSIPSLALQPIQDTEEDLEIIFPEPPSMESVAERAWNGTAYWDWVVEITAVIEDRMRRFRNSVKVDDTEVLVE